MNVVRVVDMVGMAVRQLEGPLTSLTSSARLRGTSASAGLPLPFVADMTIVDFKKCQYMGGSYDCYHVRDLIVGRHWR
jgi:hypothetical protein